MDRDTRWMEDSYADYSDLSGVLAPPEVHDESGDADSDGRSSTDTLVGKENTPLAPSGTKDSLRSTPASRLSSSAQLARRKDVPVNVTELIERNKELELKVFELKNNINVLNRDLPWLSIEGKDHLAEYIANKHELEELREEATALKKRLGDANIDHDQREYDLRNAVDDLKRERDEAIKELQLAKQSQAAAPGEMNFSIGSDGSLFSDRSRQMGYMEDEIDDLKRKLVEANEEDSERVRCETVKELADKVKEYENKLTMEETFQIGALCSKPECSLKISQTLEKMDELKNQLGQEKEEARKAASVIKDYMKKVDELNRELRAVRDHSMSRSMIVDNAEVDVIMQELLELSEMNSRLQEECRRRGAARAQRGGEDAGQTYVKQELETTIDLCEQYKKMGDRFGPLRDRLQAVNSSLLEKRSFLDGLKAFECSGLTPARDVSPATAPRSAGGTPDTPHGRKQHSRLLQSVLQRSHYMNASADPLLNCSLNTSQDVRVAKEKVSALRESCRLLFTRLQSSAALFEEIRVVLGGDEHSDLVRRIRELQYDTESSMLNTNEATEALEIVEHSLFELHSMIERETSLRTEAENSRFSDFNLENRLAATEGGVQGGGVAPPTTVQTAADDERRLTYSVQVTATAVRADVAELQETLDRVNDDYRKLHSQYQQFKQEYDQLSEDRNHLVERMRDLETEREELYRDVEKGREREDRIRMEAEERLQRQLSEAAESVQKSMAEMEQLKDHQEAVVSGLQDDLDRLDAEVAEARQLRETVSRQKETIDRMTTVEQELTKTKAELVERMDRYEKAAAALGDEEKERTRAEHRLGRTEEELRTYKDNCDRMSEMYEVVKQSLAATEDKLRDAQSRVDKYKKKLEDDRAQQELAASQMDRRGTQTRLCMDDIDHIEREQAALLEGLNSLARVIAAAFLKPEYAAVHTQSVFTAADIAGLIRIVEDKKRMCDESDEKMAQLNRQLNQYANEAEMALPSPSPEHSCAPIDVPTVQGASRVPPLTLTSATTRSASMTSVPAGPSTAQSGASGAQSGASSSHKYEDPLCQIFYDLTAAADAIVQAFKSKAPRMTAGDMTQAEFNQLLTLLRNHRAELNERFAVVNQKKLKGSDMINMALKIQSLEKDKKKLLLAMQKLSKPDISAEDKARLLKLISKEVECISTALSTAASTSKRTTASTSTVPGPSTNKH